MAELQLMITGVSTAGQERLLRILQGILNISISALKATIKSLLNCKQPKAGVNNAHAFYIECNACLCCLSWSSQGRWLSAAKRY